MQLDEVFAVLKPDLRVETIATSPTVYQELDERFDNFRSHVLVSEYSFSGDWPSWERHPAGDEIVVLLAGAVRFVLETDGGEQIAELSEPGSYVVVPRGVWHTARLSEPARMLFITPGEGTEHRAGD